MYVYDYDYRYEFQLAARVDPNISDTWRAKLFSLIVLIICY